MDQADIILRPEEPADHRQVEALTRAAFWNVNVPGCDEHYLAHVLRESPYFLPELDLVAELAGRVVGNIMYARALVRCGEQAHPALTFGPVSVLPEFQGRGIGRALIGTSLRLASELGHPAVMIYGDPNYYMRFGFIPAESFGIRTRDGMFSPALQALELVPGWLEGKSGRFEEPSVYDLDPEKAAEFDQEFPPREKLVTATQARFQELLSQSRF